MEPMLLIEPADGSETYPLQKHYWLTDEELEAGGEAAEEEKPSASLFNWRQLEIVTPDRSLPRPVVFSWHPLPGRWRRVTYDVEVSTRLDFRDAIVVPALKKPLAEVSHLYIATRYYWRVTARQGARTVAQSPTWSFRTHPATPRWIRVPGTSNVRDIGGWPLSGNRAIRQGVIYRSSELNGRLHVTSRGRYVLESDLGIRTDIDLRAEMEGASPALDPEKVRWVHAPISPYDSISDEAFREAYRLVFETFTDHSNYPILFHCVGGADRAGTVAFILNAVLGKSREHLIRDYELTTLSLWGERHRSSEQFQALLETLRPFGRDDDLAHQAENYLLWLGLTQGHVDALRRHLIVRRSD